jgi:hypothetical protein
MAGDRRQNQKTGPLRRLQPMRNGAEGLASLRHSLPWHRCQKTYGAGRTPTPISDDGYAVVSRS